MSHRFRAPMMEPLDSLDVYTPEEIARAKAEQSAADAAGARCAGVFLVALVVCCVLALGALTAIGNLRRIERGEPVYVYVPLPVMSK